jgi:16S rRNA (adenine1518-N6/adenine1519-N6)-dimethyltransferase
MPEPTAQTACTDRGTDALPPIRDVIRRHGLGAKRSLGQNFILDINLTRRIVRAAGPLAGTTVIEVGPGPGGLTRALVESEAKRIIAIERDPRCVEALADLVTASGGRLFVVGADALAVDLDQYIEHPTRIVANLPYNVGTPLLIRWIGIIDRLAGMTLMFQKEVARRLVAAPRSRDYGRLSVLVQRVSAVRLLFDIGPKSFVPPPKVTSTVVDFRPLPHPVGPVRPDMLERVTAAAFGQRRKMLRSSLRSLGVETSTLLAGAGINPTARAEELPIEAFCALARVYEEVLKNEKA